jgi:AbrB family looped-hinge helix DNA binding protein
LTNLRVFLTIKLEITYSKGKGASEMPITAKITQKGQVTIPRKIRDKLGSEVIEFDIVKDQVIIRPILSIAGSLRDYAKKGPVPFKEAREKAWDEITQEKYGQKTGRR